MDCQECEFYNDGDYTWGFQTYIFGRGEVRLSSICEDCPNYDSDKIWAERLARKPEPIIPIPLPSPIGPVYLSGKSKRRAEQEAKAKTKKPKGTIEIPRQK